MISFKMKTHRAHLYYQTWASCELETKSDQVHYLENVVATPESVPNTVAEVIIIDGATVVD